jgi:hypothetical protein
MFETRERAIEAGRELARQGFPESQISLLDPDEPGQETAHANPPAWLPREDEDLYADGLRRGHALLTVRVEPGDRTRAEAILGRFGPLPPSRGPAAAGAISGDDPAPLSRLLHLPVLLND